MKKKVEEAAATSLTVRKVSEYLNIDPEMADFYLFRFITVWGEAKYKRLINFIIEAEEAGKPGIIAPALEHDFDLPYGAKEPVTWEGI